MIDTWNRDHKGPNFVPGPLPKAAVSPPDAIYSGLLECPCTDRISKIIDGAYVLQQTERVPPRSRMPTSVSRLRRRNWAFLESRLGQSLMLLESPVVQSLCRRTLLLQHSTKQ